jgi:hypothetical protein
VITNRRPACGAAVAPGEQPAQLVEVLGRVDVELERRQLRDAARDARGGRRLLVALAAAGPEGRLDDVRRREDERVRAGAVPVGDDRDRASEDRRREQRLELGRIERRDVAGHEQDPREPRLERVRDADLRRRALAGLQRVGEDARAVAAPDRLRRRLGGHEHDVVDGGRPAQRHEDVGDHRLRERAASPARQHIAEAHVRGEKALHGNDRERPLGGRRHQLRPSANRSVASATRRRCSPSESRMSVRSTGSPSTASSATSPSSSPA